MLSKVLNEAGLTGTLIAYNETNDMYKVRLNIDSNRTMTCWYTEEEIKDYYHSYKDRKRQKREQHEKYIQQKKAKKKWGDFIKNIIFDILNKIKPYELIKIQINNEELYICREDAYFPLAIRSIDYEPEMENGNYFYSHNTEELHNYIKSHRYTLDENEYIIENEVTYIKYHDRYIHLAMASISGTYDYFIPYNSISCACLIHSNNMSRCCNGGILNYNKIQYELNKGE